MNGNYRGLGYPLALHLSETFKFSLTITSELVSAFMKSGGTKKQNVL
jgi:hypothetical protein